MAESKKQIRTRFAPSPTGFVHIGNLRTALFNFLFARHSNGVHILRVEDTDQSRKVEGAVEHLLRIMHDMGIDFDEGVCLDDQGQVKEKGEHGPYFQSERLGLYKKYAQQLVDKGAAYYCFCAEARLDELRQEQIALKKPAMYDRHCRYLPEQEVNQKLNEFKDSGKNPVVRQAIPEQGSTSYNDLIYGDVTFEHKNLDDQVLLKSDSYPTYHLAVVVDDHLMDVTHTIRGEEYLSSAPKHVLLYKALGWEPPLFAHMPLILNPDKSKLSKRQGDVTVEDFLQKGYLKEALINFIAFLGWNPKTEQEIFSLEELTQQFDLSKVNRAGAVFDVNKLDWLNGLYIRCKSNAELAAILAPFWQQSGVDVSNYKPEYLEAIVALEKERLKKLSEIGDRTIYFFHVPEYQAELLIWKKSDAAATKKVLIDLLQTLQPAGELSSPPAWENLLKQFIADHNYDNGTVLWPFRVALTGVDKSPGPFEVAAVLTQGLSKEEITMRLQKAVEKLS